MKGEKSKVSKSDVEKMVAEKSGMTPKEVKDFLQNYSEIVQKVLEQQEEVNVLGDLVKLKVRQKPATKAGTRMMFGKKVNVKAKGPRTVVKAFPMKKVKDQFSQTKAKK